MYACAPYVGRTACDINRLCAIKRICYVHIRAIVSNIWIVSVFARDNRKNTRLWFFLSGFRSLQLLRSRDKAKKKKEDNNDGNNYIE